MMAFRMTVETAAEFYRRAALLKLDTEEARTALLIAMAQEGLIDGVVETEKTPEQYVEHLKKNFDVLDLTKAEKPNEGIS